MHIAEKLSKIQAQLNAPKSQFNNFGKYHYRNCEDILQALKPFLLEHKCHILLNDEIVVIGNRIYIKAAASISDGENSISATALAREPESRKGMDDSQVTGSSSSYARKYALNGLFAIDDNKDADTPQQALPTLDNERFQKACQAVRNGEFDKRKLLTDFQLTQEQRQVAMSI